MHREKLKKLLYLYQPKDNVQKKILHKTINFVEENPLCFERTLSIGHITGSAFILDSTQKFGLFTHHKKLDKWLQLGGHADGDSDILNVALREAQEESGINDIQPISNQIFDIDIHTVPAHGKDPEHLHYDIRFLFETNKKNPLIITKESKQLAWIPLQKISEYTMEESVLRMVQKIQTL